MTTTFEELLARDGRLVYKTKGTSMEPMLRQNRDLVVIEVPASRLKKDDVAFYRRGESYVLHRVIDVKEDRYLIRGDNTYTLENVPEKAVLGVLTAFVRKGKQHSVDEDGYRRYVRFWNVIYPLRAVCFRCKRRSVGIARKLGILPLLKKILRRE
ncbi:MAG: S24/S26 family peptidase [Oscillospiraceae bacterium]|nr:S24/S26 family peptidase [Oscillospiraceae bacterium]